MTEHETTPPPTLGELNLRHMQRVEDDRFLAAVNPANLPEPCTAPATDPYAAWLAANGLTDQHEERPAEPAPPKRPAEPKKLTASAALWLANMVFESIKSPTLKLLFVLAFIVVAAFYYKDQRLAEEAKKAEEPAALTQKANPNTVPDGWKTLSDLELARLGFRRITPAEAEKLIFPGGIVVKAGKQATPGYRVVHVEGAHAFLEDLGDSGKYLTLPVGALEPKRVPELMPPPPPLKTR
jgi:hypothetical protein